MSLPKTEWPTHDQSLKTLAKFLGFKWRDTHPSGAHPSSGLIDGAKNGHRKFGNASLTTTRTIAALRESFSTGFERSELRLLARKGSLHLYWLELVSFEQKANKVELLDRKLLKAIKWAVILSNPA